MSAIAIIGAALIILGFLGLLHVIGISLAISIILLVVGLLVVLLSGSGRLG